jgi:hypothetical protein
VSRRDLMALAALAAAPAALLLVFSGHAAAAPVWVQQAKLLASDGKGGDELGYSLAVSGDTVIAGTPWDSQVDNNSGAVYVYVFERSRGTWSEQQILSASDPPFGYDYFGYSVGLFGDTLVVGTLTDGGQVRYVRKRTFSDGTRELPFTPRDFVARLCALVPPPRFHQVRYHRILAAHARGRYALTGRGLHDGGVDRGRSRLDRSLGEEIMWSGEAKRSIIRAFIVSRATPMRSARSARWTSWDWRTRRARSRRPGGAARRGWLFFTAQRIESRGYPLRSPTRRGRSGRRRCGRSRPGPSGPPVPSTGGRGARAPVRRAG